MMKKSLIATVVVFVAWSVMDFLLHGMVLQSSYASTPALWRAQAEMNMGALYLSVFIGALAFTMIYARLIQPKGPRLGYRYGAWFGIAKGIGMGLGTYAVQPIPSFMALVWLLGTIAECIVAGFIVAAIVKE